MINVLVGAGGVRLFFEIIIGVAAEKCYVTVMNDHYSSTGEFSLGFVINVGLLKVKWSCYNMVMAEKRFVGVLGFIGVNSKQC